MKQVATDISTILTQPPSNTTPSLQAGGPVRNAQLTLATQLTRIEQILPVVETVVPPLRVSAPIIAQHYTLVKQPPMVQLNTPIPASTLQVHSKKIKIQDSKTQFHILTNYDQRKGTKELTLNILKHNS